MRMGKNWKFRSLTWLNQDTAVDEPANIFWTAVMFFAVTNITLHYNVSFCTAGNLEKSQMQNYYNI